MTHTINHAPSIPSPEDMAGAESVQNQLEQINAKITGHNVPTYEDLQQARPVIGQLSPTENGGFLADEGFVDPDVAKSVIINTDPKRWELSDEDVDAYSAVASAKSADEILGGPSKDVATRQYDLAKKFVSELPEDTTTEEGFAQYKEYAAKRIKLNDFLADPKDAAEKYAAVPDTAKEQTAAIPSPRTPQNQAPEANPSKRAKVTPEERRKDREFVNEHSEEIKDIVSFNEAGKPLRSNGKLMSNRELRSIIEHQDEIRAGVPAAEVTVAEETAEEQVVTTAPKSRRRATRAQTTLGTMENTADPVIETEEITNTTPEADDTEEIPLDYYNIYKQIKLKAGPDYPRANRTKRVDTLPPVPGSDEAVKAIDASQRPELTNQMLTLPEVPPNWAGDDLPEVPTNKMNTLPPVPETPRTNLDRIMAQIRKEQAAERAEGEKDYLKIEDALVEAYAEKGRRESFRGRMMARVYGVQDRFNGYFFDSEKGKKRRIGGVLAAGALAIGASVIAARGWGSPINFSKAHDTVAHHPSAGGAANHLPVVDGAPAPAPAAPDLVISKQNPTISHLAVQNLKETGQAINPAAVVTETHRLQELNGISDAAARLEHVGDHIRRN